MRVQARPASAPTPTDAPAAQSRDGAPSPGVAAHRADATSPQRWHSLDALRGVAVLLMIEQHLGVWLWQGPAAGRTAAHYPGLLTFNALGGGAAPTFILLAGVGTSLLAARKAGADAISVRRGLVLLAMGYALSQATPSWFSWRSWFVLHLMGVGMCLAPIWRRLPSWALCAVALCVLAATPALQLWLDTPPLLTNARMAGWTNDLKDAILPWAPARIALAEGQFPIFPWLAFFVLGVWAGRHLARGELAPIAAGGGALLALGGVGALGYYALRVPALRALPQAFSINVPFFPATPTFVALLAGGILLIVSAVFAMDRRARWRESAPLVCLGRGSLTLLLLHVPLFREGSIATGLWRSLPAWQVGAVLAGVSTIAVIACVQWRRADYRWGAEWLLRRLAG